MPRRSRLALAGIPWHVIQRGNNRTACFYTEDDYRYYLQHLEAQAKQFSCAIHAYVLMTNHVHLLLTPEQATGPSLMMKHLGQRYVQYINKTYRRSGTLWEGRFRSGLTQADHHVLTCMRYIELNPVRAGMVSDPSDYPWSSYRIHGLGEKSTLLTHHFLYCGLGKDAVERQMAYRELFKTHLEDEIIDDIRNAANGNYSLGNEKFKLEIEQIVNRRASPGKSGRPRKNNNG